MPKWTKEAVLKELQDLIREADQVAPHGAYSAAHVRWELRTRRLLGEVFGHKSVYLQSITVLPWRATGSFVVQSSNLQAGIEEHHFRAFVQQIDTTKGLLQAAWDELDGSTLDDVYHGKDTAPESSAILRVLNLAEHRLRKVIRKPPTKEVEVQEALENLFVGAEISYSRESDIIEYSSKTYRPDFTIKQLDLAIDVKLCARTRREKEIIAEINDDILAYQTKYGNILFIVYDVGQIRDSDRFAGSFEEHENVMIRVVKH